MSNRERHIYEFGAYRLDTEECQLFRHGEAVPLTPKAFETLVVLVSRSGHLVEKDELMKEVWPDSFVEEVGLARNISSLRKVLGEGEGGQQYIGTVPKRGYRFVAPVRDLSEEGAELILKQQISAQITTEEEEDTASQDPDEWKREIVRAERPSDGHAAVKAWAKNLISAIKRRKRRALLALATLVLAASGSAYIACLIYQRPKISGRPIQYSLARLTFDPGLQIEPTWSPDARFIAYSSERGGKFDIWVQPVGGGDAVQVTKARANDWQPDWSPDGNRIVFRSERDGGGLYVVPALGGHEQKISSFGYRPRWSPDGSKVLFIDTWGGTIMDWDMRSFMSLTWTEARRVKSWRTSCKG